MKCFVYLVKLFFFLLNFAFACTVLRGGEL
jgi:hypothetical protein